MLLLSIVLNEVYPGMRGSSGRLWRYRSRFLLKSITVPSVKFLSRIGRELNSLGPLMANDEKRIVFTRAGALDDIFGTWHSLPLRPCHAAVIPQLRLMFGT